MVKATRVVVTLMSAAQPTGGRSRPLDRRVTASEVPTVPGGLPASKPSRTPIVTRDPAARRSSSPSTAMTALASAKTGTTT
jgi:hypothetical protein